MERALKYYNLHQLGIYFYHLQHKQANWILDSIQHYSLPPDKVFDE